MNDETSSYQASLHAIWYATYNDTTSTSDKAYAVSKSLYAAGADAALQKTW